MDVIIFFGGHKRKEDEGNILNDIQTSGDLNSIFIECDIWKYSVHEAVVHEGQQEARGGVDGNGKPPDVPLRHKLPNG